MARITIEDCVVVVPNRFDLCLYASVRAKNILSGSAPQLEDTKEKAPVISLREIAEGALDIESIKKSIVAGIENQIVATADDTVLANEIREYIQTEAEEDVVDEAVSEEDDSSKKGASE